MSLKNWKQSSGLESAFSNNMVTYSVEGYEKGDHLLLCRRTKVSNSVELYKKLRFQGKMLLKREEWSSQEEKEELLEEMSSLI